MFLASAENAFSTDGEPFDYVVNFAAETKYGQSEPVSTGGDTVCLAIAELGAREKKTKHIKSL